MMEQYRRLARTPAAGRPEKLPWLGALLMLGGGLGLGYVAAEPALIQGLARSTVGQFGLAGCTIKGNISINSGERIYHMPGQRDYEGTRIHAEYGERWFCSEREARAAGWRRAGR
jgi:hypothetical protein